MKTLVTGATGFIGANLVRALLAQNREVRALVRETSDRRNLAGLDVEIAVGDLRDRDSVFRACRGVRRVFHAGALYVSWTEDVEDLRAINVRGTRHVLEGALAAGVERVVHTSCIAAIGSAPEGGWADENAKWDFGDIEDPYAGSKHSAELEVVRIQKTGLPVVIVNPTAPVGGYDLRPAPTGKLLVEYAHRRIPAYADVTLNVVDVEDVARGHLLAEERGTPYERYILGGENLTVHEFFGMLQEATGIPRPALGLPLWTLLVAAWPLHWWADHVTHRPPLLSLPLARMAYKRLAYSHLKAENELGYKPGPVLEAVRRAYAYFDGLGYLPRRPG
ncbi:MAG: NAD-dependent epimerase/dehydratase family protein [Planctomycetes bacterium]|nr:NAD-dependent epimerase/dehydratase family protein [Planctomycetota bacterium]